MGTDPDRRDTDDDGRPDGEELWIDGTDPTADERIVCPSTSYDVDGDPANGCEVVDPGPGNHTQGTATDLGSRSCEDTASDPAIVGRLLSDAAVHNPPLAGFDAVVGRPPIGTGSSPMEGSSARTTCP